MKKIILMTTALSSFVGCAAQPMTIVHEHDVAPLATMTSPAPVAPAPTTVKVPSVTVSPSLETKPSTAALGTSLEAFGAKCDGATDDSAAMTAAVSAINAGTFAGLELSGETCLVPGTYQLKRGYVRGVGALSALKTTANAPLLKILSDASAPLTTVVDVYELSLVGNGAGTSQTGLQIGDPTVAGSGIAYGSFHDLYVSGMGGDGIAYAENPLTGAPSVEGPLFSNLVIHDCLNGINFQHRGEFVSVVNASVQRCSGTGLIIGAGNVEVSNSHFDLNHNGISITNGENGSHGGLDNVTANHNGNIGLEYAGTNGERITNSAFFQSNIQVDAGARGLLIADSQIDVGAMVFGANSTTELADCMFGAGYGDTVTVDPTASVQAFHPTMWSDGSVPSFLVALVKP